MKFIDNTVKTALAAGGLLLGAHFAPEIVDITLKLTPNYLDNALKLLQNPSEKAYAAIGLTGSYFWGKKSQINLNPLEKILAGSALLAGTLHLGDAMVNNIPVLHNAYGASYSLAGMLSGLSLMEFLSSENRSVLKFKSSARACWNSIKNYAAKNQTRKNAALSLAIIASTYQCLPETTKARLHPQSLTSDYAFTFQLSKNNPDQTRLWIYQTYEVDLIKAEQLVDRKDIDRYLLAGLIFVESKGDKYALSCTGAAGVAQFIPSTAAARKLPINPDNVMVPAFCGGRPVRSCRKGTERQCDFTEDRFFPEKSIPAAAEYLAGLHQNLPETLRRYGGRSKKDYTYSKQVIGEAKKIKEIVESGKRP